MKLKAIYSLFVALVLFTGCHGDLDIVQTSQVSANSMWTSEGDATSAMYGMHNQLRKSFSTGLVYWGEYRTGLWGDGLTGTTSNDQVFQNQIPTNHGYANWADLYTVINTANLIIRYTPTIGFASETTQNKVLANAYYVRALCYYWIGRIWGDAPILLEGFESDDQEGLYPTRDNADAVFAQVGKDLEMARQLMPASVDDRNMASLASIRMLQADYSLWMYKVRGAGDTSLQQAADAVNAVLNDGNYGLEDTFSDIFTNELGKEIIFAWSYIQDEYTGGYPSDYLVPSQYVSPELIENPIKTGSHQQWVFYTEEYKQVLTGDPDDQRTLVSFETAYDEAKGSSFQWINKFAGSWINETRVFDSDLILYRYADAVLFDAEIKLAKHDVAGAVASLNRIAQRAYGKTNYYASSLSEHDVNEAIVTERMREFAAEGKLWWDFIRTGVVFEKAPYLKGRENETNVLLWPVSQTSINKNPNITQTLGYDK